MELPNGDQLMVPFKPATSFRDLFEAQEDLFLSQMEKAQKIVENQSKLTGVNPISQEMAAGALSVKIRKRPQDLLNPKAIKYMQLVFSIKDAISKRETREISARLGVTPTQVRDFFTSRRSRVRKLALLPKEKANQSTASDEMPSNSNPDLEPIPLNTIESTNPEVGPSHVMQHEVLHGEENSDQHFMDNIFGLMRKEESFSGQVKLLEWILEMKSQPVLNWFLTEDGVMILATWLCEAAKEDQTSVVHAILKVLCHLPLHKALPVHMSAILQSVNRLRFYRTSDISRKARILLSKWSKMFAKIQASNKQNGKRSASHIHDEMLLKQSIDEVMGTESWDPNVHNPEEAPRLLCENPDKSMKLLTAPGDDSNKRLGVLPFNMRERRKVKMMEHPGQRIAVKSQAVAKTIPSIQSRPLSADDIQKAKMRAQLMQSKYGKIYDNAHNKLPENITKCSTSEGGIVPSLPKVLSPEIEDQGKLNSDDSSNYIDTQEATNLNMVEPPWKRCKSVQIPWQTPREMTIASTWQVGSGENSKEVEVQKTRIHRERETIYRTLQEIPSNPRDPWDSEMDYDDSLTPEIPIEQAPDVEPIETSSVSSNNVVVSTTTTGNVAEPDLELLAELLKTPELVFALTSGKAGDLSSDSTVKLLDMIKANGVSALSNLGGREDNKVEVSLPSPTPSTDHVPNGSKPDFSRNPFSRQRTTSPIGNAYQFPGASPSLRPQETIPVVVSPVSPLKSYTQLPEQWRQPPTNPSVHHYYTSNAQHLTPEMMNYNRAQPNVLGSPSHMVRQDNLSGRAYLPEPIMGSHSSRASPGFQPIYQYQNEPNPNNYDYNTRGRDDFTGRPKYESWSPEDSPHRPYEYNPAQNYPEPRANLRHETGQLERGMPQNLTWNSGFLNHGMGGAGNKRARDHRR